jgi:transcriptional regulator with XRE-family HTH domain
MLGKRLCQLREENRLTQKELAKHLGLTGRAIGYYEAEERCPAPDTLNKIADFFNVSIDWLFGRTDIRTPVNIIADGGKVRYAPCFDDDEVVSSKELYEFLEKKSRKNCR